MTSTESTKESFGLKGFLRRPFLALPLLAVWAGACFATVAGNSLLKKLSDGYAYESLPVSFTGESGVQMTKKTVVAISGLDVVVTTIEERADGSGPRKQTLWRGAVTSSSSGFIEVKNKTAEDVRYFKRNDDSSVAELSVISTLQPFELIP